jgi:polyferredoxin
MNFRSRNAIERRRWSPAETRQAFLFWFFWLAFVGLSATVVIALFTDWPTFLHAGWPMGR